MIRISYDNELEQIDVDTKRCDMEYCNELTEKNEKYCLKCEKLLDDSNWE